MTGQRKEIRPGVWKLRVSAGKDPVTGKYIYVAKTVYGGPRLASQELAKLAVSAKNERGSGISLERLLAEFFDSCARSAMAAKTLFGYREIARNHIVPNLGGKSIDKLTARDLDNLYRQMAEKGLSASRVHHVHAVLSRALGQALKWGWVTTNVAKLASPPTARRTVAVAPSPEELGQVLTVTSQRSPQLAAVFALCALTGARRGEALALRWSDYDREVKVLTIARSIGYTPNDGIYEKATKTHSVRKIGVDEILEGVIVSQIDALEKNTELGFYLVDDPFLFYGLPDGSKPLHPDTPSKYFRKMCNQLGLSYHLHQLRHFTATELIAAGVDIRTVSGRLGHADASVTLRVYSHVLEAQDRAASEYIGSRVFIPKPIDRT